MYTKFNNLYTQIQVYVNNSIYTFLSQKHSNGRNKHCYGQNAAHIRSGQCLSQDLDFFSKKELLKFFRELFAKERSYPFHDENLANVYQMRVLYARTCRNHLENL